MPIAIATCWLSATARIAMPLRDLRKNQPNPARKTRLTAPPRSWIGGMNSGPMTNGSSRMGSGRGFVPAPRKVGPIPRRIDASPMVAMTTAITGRPMSLRRVTRSRAKPKPTMTSRPSMIASQSGAPQTSRLAATTSPAIITNSPCAKFTASVALYTRTNPSAMSAYMRPISTPLEVNSSRNPRSSSTGRCPLHVLDADAGLDRGLPAILVRDGRRQLDLVPSAVERVDHRRVLVRDVAPAHLACARHLGVVGLEILGEEQEAADLRGVGQRLIALPDLLADEVPHLRLLRQIHVRRVGQAAPLRPVADRAEVDGDHRGHRGALVTERDGLADERAELELVLDELRREGRPVLERADVLGAIDDDQVAPRVDEARVARVEPAVGIDDLARGLLVLEVALEDRTAAHHHLPALADLHLDAGHGPPRRRGIGLGIRLERDQPGGLGRSVDLFQVDADRPEEPERVGAERRPA